MIIRKIARLQGKFTSSFPAVRFGSLHYRSLERNKILAFKFTKGKFDKKMKVSRLEKWAFNIEDSFSPIKIPNCSFLLKANASTPGWGAIFNKETNGGHFESLLQITVLELKAVLFGLKSLCSRLRQIHINV